MSISRPLQANGTLKFDATIGWMAPTTPMLLKKRRGSKPRAAGAVLNISSKLPAVENDLATAAGEEGGIGVGVLDVVTGSSREVRREKAGAKQSPYMPPRGGASGEASERCSAPSFSMI